MEALSDDDLVFICLNLRVADVLSLSATCQRLRDTLFRSRHLWRTASVRLLGEPLVSLHLTAWRSPDTPRFHRRLVRAATTCDSLAYANTLRRDITHGLSPEDMKRIVCATGHTASACGSGLIAVVGGWRPSCPLTHLHVCVIDVHGRALRVPKLANSSAKPARRMRHAAAIVATPHWAIQRLPAGSPMELPSVLVLGGACDGGAAGEDGPPPGEERGEPVKGGLLTLTLLSFCATDGSVVTWQEAHASGTAPGAMWHHQCAPFKEGTRVVVFGGDMPRDDPEFEHISDRASASHVYVLDVPSRLWERVRTSGEVPSWRSLHVGLGCRPPSTGREALLILGGSDEHVKPFSSGDCADFHPHVLDLTTYQWRKGGGSGASRSRSAARGGAAAGEIRPTPRMRFAAEAYGEHVLLYSGHGDRPIPAQERVLRLDLGTLRWSKMRVRNGPVSLSDTPAACLAGGVLIAGVQMQPLLGVQVCQKLDLLCLAEPPEDDGMLGGELEDEARSPLSAASPAGSSAAGATESEAASKVAWEGSPKKAGEASGTTEPHSAEEDDEDDAAAQRAGLGRMVRMPRPISAHLRSSPLISAFARPGPLRRALALLEWQARTGPYLPRLGAHAAAGSISALRSARLLSSLLSPVTRYACSCRGPTVRRAACACR